MTQDLQQEITIVKEITHPLFSFYKRSDGIIVEVTVDRANFTLKECEDVVAVTKEITGGVPHKLLFIPGKHITLDKQGRSFMASDEALENISAMAVIQTSITIRVIGNLYLIIDRPKKPTRLFDNTDEALDWLKRQP